MLRFLSSFLLLNTALWFFLVRWRRERWPDRVWIRPLVVWGIWIALGWISMAVHTAIMLRIIR